MSASRIAPRVLVADDDPLVLQLMTMVFSSGGCAVTGCSNGDAALAAIRERGYRLIVLDYRMPGRTGLDVVRELRSGDDTTPILLVSGSFTDDIRKECAGYARLQVLEKPFTTAALRAAMAWAVRESPGRP